jgi:hypothetical protein
MNETLNLIGNPKLLVIGNQGNLFVQNSIHSGWIYSPTITTIAIFLGILIGWNIWLTYKLIKLNKLNRA